jgi:alpha-glucosidase
MHRHIFDSERKHVAFPDRIMPVPGIRGIRPSQSSLQLHYDMSPFAFWVTRRSTGETLIDTRASSLPEAAGARPLVFEDQYLQLASRLPYGANIYGLGEVAATSGFRRDENATRQAFWAHDRAVPVDTNLCAELVTRMRSL